jgi:hypothetical protein
MDSKSTEELLRDLDTFMATAHVNSPGPLGNFIDKLYVAIIGSICEELALRGFHVYPPPRLLANFIQVYDGP